MDGTINLKHLLHPTAKTSLNATKAEFSAFVQLWMYRIVLGFYAYQLSVSMSCIFNVGFNYYTNSEQWSTSRTMNELLLPVVGLYFIQTAYALSPTLRNKRRYVSFGSKNYISCEVSLSIHLNDKFCQATTLANHTYLMNRSRMPQRMLINSCKGGLELMPPRCESWR